MKKEQNLFSFEKSNFECMIKEFKRESRKILSDFNISLIASMKDRKKRKKDRAKKRKQKTMKRRLKAMKRR
jgi:hypothetical protein